MTSRAKSPSLDEVRSAPQWLKSHSTKTTLDGMARYGIPSDTAFGVAMKDMKVARQEARTDHGRFSGLEGMR